MLQIQLFHLNPVLRNTLFSVKKQLHYCIHIWHPKHNDKFKCQTPCFKLSIQYILYSKKGKVVLVLN
jgi:hypothetical protein